MNSPLIDLDAARREVAFPDGIPVRFGGDDFLLPAELPVDVFDPLLSEELDLVGIIKQVLTDRPEKDGGDAVGDVVLEVLLARPALPRQTLDAVKAVFAALFGDDYSRFAAHRPSVQDHIRLARALMNLYGVGLGEALGSPDSSESDGETSSPTSDASTDSTPDGSGSSRKKKRSSASDG